VAGVDDAVDRGVELILLAVRDDAAARLVAAKMLALTAVEASGWPLENGLDDEDWMDAVTDLRDGLWRLRGRSEVTEVLREVASPDLAAATAIALHAAGRRTPVLLDGEGATCAALLARRGGYAANQWWQIAHTAGSSLMDQAIASLQLDPILRLGLRVQDGTGARLGLEVLVEAARLLAR
jgi:nicotinate-nucleotide--dimethylbenzimidazole phosphoribosyltransferase